MRGTTSGSHGNSLDQRSHGDDLSGSGSSVDLDKYANAGAHYADVFHDQRLSATKGRGGGGGYIEGQMDNRQGYGDAAAGFQDQVDRYENQEYDYVNDQFSGSHERVTSQGSSKRGQSRSQSQGSSKRGRSRDLDQGQVDEIRVLGVPQTAEEVVAATMDSSEGEEVSDIEGEDYDAFPPNHMTSNRRDNHFAPPPPVTRPHKRSHRRHQQQPMGGEQDSDPDGKPPIVGDSIFTQEEFSNNRQSLAEFEQLEAALDVRVGGGGGGGGDNEAADQMDLIGAYLKGKKISIL